MFKKLFKKIGKSFDCLVDDIFSDRDRQLAKEINDSIENTYNNITDTYNDMTSGFSMFNDFFRTRITILKRKREVKGTVRTRSPKNKHI
jgi:hypothetical protein